VIVECGFLSNWEEADLLCRGYYQENVAWAIHLGIIEFINKYKKTNKAQQLFQMMYNCCALI